MLAALWTASAAALAAESVLLLFFLPEVLGASMMASSSSSPCVCVSSSSASISCVSPAPKQEAAAAAIRALDPGAAAPMEIFAPRSKLHVAAALGTAGVLAPDPGAICVNACVMSGSVGPASSS